MQTCIVCFFQKCRDSENDQIQLQKYDECRGEPSPLRNKKAAGSEDISLIETTRVSPERSVCNLDKTMPETPNV